MRSDELLDIETPELIRIMKQWGWRHDSEGVKEVRLRHPDHGKLTVRKTKTKCAAGPAVAAAQHHGVSITAFLAGPKNADPEIAALPYDEQELEWFKNTKVETLFDPDQKRKYRAMRTQLAHAGVLDKIMGREPDKHEHVCTHFIGKPPACASCLKLKEPEVQTAAEQEQQLRQDLEARGHMDDPEPIEPLPVETDQEGWITLQAALSMMNTLQVGDGRARTLCEMIALLSLGTVEDEKGAAVRKVLSLIPGGNRDEPIGYSGVALNIQKMKKAGLIWTAPDNGARTKQIGLCMPVKLSDKEKATYLYEPVVEEKKPDYIPHPEGRAPHSFKCPECEAEVGVPHDTRCTLAMSSPLPGEVVKVAGSVPLTKEYVDDLPVRGPFPDAIDEAEAAKDVDIAVEVLEAKRDEYLAKAAQLTHAIEILTA